MDRGREGSGPGPDSDRHDGDRTIDRSPPPLVVSFGAAEIRTYDPGLSLGWDGAATGAVRAPGIYRGAVDQMSTAPRLLRAALARSGLILGLGSLRHGIRKRCRSRVHASDAAVITAGQPSCVRGA